MRLGSPVHRFEGGIMASQSVLIVDDEVIWHRLLGRLLRELGYDVHTAASCSDGVRLAELHSPDCIILDFHLGDGDAVKVCSKLKANPKTAQIPVIVFSSDPAVEITAYTECKAVCFVLKGSTSIADLTAAIHDTLCPDMFRKPGTSGLKLQMP